MIKKSIKASFVMLYIYWVSLWCTFFLCHLFISSLILYDVWWIQKQWLPNSDLGNTWQMQWFLQISTVMQPDKVLLLFLVPIRFRVPKKCL